ncbi:universal stress protein [Puia sp. P3]|uniref:universal stress protein n=1 Tax=Puia sp. P3 TaxID=3423952 RepID=UPI003D66BF05
MRSLIVPVNFSECASCAARYASDLAMAIEGELHLINVVEYPFTSPDLVMSEDVYGVMLDSANIYLKEMQTELQKRTANKVPVHISVGVGDVFAQVEQLCQTVKPYAIVIGSSGPTFEKFIAGSRIGALLRLPWPVLVIPERETFHYFKNITLACDPTDLDSGLPHSLPLIEELHQRFNATIDVVTVGANGNATAGQFHLQSKAWQDRLSQVQPRLHMIHGKNIEEGLFHFLADNPADLVVVFPKKHNFLEFHTRQSKKIAKHSSIPVMSLHE